MYIIPSLPERAPVPKIMKKNVQSALKQKSQQPICGKTLGLWTHFV
jgi:hypothetical protein